MIERGAGVASGFYDTAYEAAGATIVMSNEELLGQTDTLLKVNAPTVEELRLLKDGAAFISFLYAYTIPDVIEVCLAKKLAAFAMDAVPRISRAQKMDALSSQANLG